MAGPAKGVRNSSVTGEGIRRFRDNAHMTARELRRKQYRPRLVTGPAGKYRAATRSSLNIAMLAAIPVLLQLSVAAGAVMPVDAGYRALGLVPAATAMASAGVEVASQWYNSDTKQKGRARQRAVKDWQQRNKGARQRIEEQGRRWEQHVDQAVEDARRRVPQKTRTQAQEVMTINDRKKSTHAGQTCCYWTNRAARRRSWPG